MNYEKQSIIDIVENAYVNYGTYVNFNRFIPNALDGLKPSYRKAIYATMKVCKDDLAGVDSVLGEAIKYYNHGSQYLVPVLCKLAKFGILRDDGANGSYFIYGDTVEHAASRYLETGVSPFYYKLFGKLINYVPYSVSDKGHNEPDYIPTPVPLGLTFGYNAISCGSNTEIPPMTAKSLIEAMIHDDPNRLKLSFGLELVKDQTNIEGIWTKGSGKMTFKYPWKFYELNGFKGILITGNPIYFKLQWKRERAGFDFTLEKLIERNYVEVQELEKIGELRQTFIKVKKPDSVNMSELARYVDDVVTNFKLIKLSTYVYNKSLGHKMVTRLSLRGWLRLCFDNYIKLLEHYKKSNIERLIKARTVLEWLPKVAEILLATKDRLITNKEIADNLKIDQWIVDEIVQKPISTLRRKDTQKQIENINEQIKQFEDFNSKEFTLETIYNIPE